MTLRASLPNACWPAAREASNERHAPLAARLIGVPAAAGVTSARRYVRPSGDAWRQLHDAARGLGRVAFQNADHVKNVLGRLLCRLRVVVLIYLMP